MKNILTVVAAGDQMIETALDLDSKFPCHIVGMIAGISQNRRRDTGFTEILGPYGIQAWGDNSRGAMEQHRTMWVEKV